MNLISYVLFGKDAPRYRDCVPIILVANSGLYPDFTTRIHIPEYLKDDPAIQLALESSIRGVKVEVKIVSRPYLGMEATCWRVMPLWEKDVDLLLCRDIDSIPCGYEVKAVRAFIETGYAIHALRGHKNHKPRLMAGLVGFRRKELDKYTIPHNFDQYMEIKTTLGWGHGCDQALLAAAFGSLGKITLDTPVRGAPSSESAVQVLPEGRLQDPSLLRSADPATVALCDRYMKFPGSTIMPSRMIVDEFVALQTPAGLAVKAAISALHLEKAFGKDKA